MFEGLIGSSVVKAGGGGSSFSPTDLDNLVLWVDAADLDQADGSLITSVTSKDPSALVLSAGAGSTQPLFEDGSDELHGEKMIHFSSLNHYLERAATTIDIANLTVFAVVQPDHTQPGANARYMMKDGSGTNPVLALQQPATGGEWLSFVRLSGGTALSCESKIASEEFLHVHEFQYNGTNLRYWIDGVLQNTTAGAGNVDSTSGKLILGNHTTVQSQGCQARMGEFIIYGRALTDDERQQVRDYLSTKYAGDKPFTIESTATLTGTTDASGPKITEYDADTWVMSFTDGTDIKYATAPKSDPHNWTVQGTLVSGPSEGCLLKDGSTWYLIVGHRSGGSAGSFFLYSGASLDSLTIQNGGSAVFSGTGTDWEQYARNPFIMKVGSTYHLFYDGRQGTPSAGSGAIGHATSSDLITWSRDAANPVVDVGSASSWESTDVGNPAVYDDGAGTYHMVYSGYNNTAGGATAAGAPHWLGLATSSDLSTWTKDSNNPVIGQVPGGWAELGGSEGTWLITSGQSRVIYYSGPVASGDSVAVGYATEAG